MSQSLCLSFLISRLISGLTTRFGAETHDSFPTDGFVYDKSIKIEDTRAHTFVPFAVMKPEFS